ncbi:hypothetical protein QMK56_10345 [Pseudomonas protegens]|uniref:hypothetical protein n=1 Tax=Pseudomonas protegens TaxID=380021 RepID=UPI002A35E2E6|nr:hypothetical protein [Pseudomonas protegens]MDX9681894.1 hypothetical protein [Pseudomonas protegens]
MTSVEEFIALSNRITMDYEAIAPLLRDPEVVKAARFLGELDKLAQHYDFSAMDIMKLIDPGRALQSEKNQKENTKKPQRRSQRTAR